MGISKIETFLMVLSAAVLFVLLPDPKPAPAPAPAAEVKTEPAPAPIIAAEVKAKPMPTVEVKAESAQTIDVQASIASWNEEAWCREHWDKENKCWFKDRQKQYPAKAKAIETAFKAVWGNSPIEIQKLALAICLKETGCGFSEQRNWRKSGGKISQTGEKTYKASKFMSKKEACGLTQVDTRDNIGKVKCAVLNSSYRNAFKWQKMWLETYWNDGKKDSKKVILSELKWLEPVKRGGEETFLVYRYNGGGRGAWKYGRKVMEIYNNHIKLK